MNAIALIVKDEKRELLEFNGLRGIIIYYLCDENGLPQCSTQYPLPPSSYSSHSSHTRRGNRCKKQKLSASEDSRHYSVARIRNRTFQPCVEEIEKCPCHTTSSGNRQLHGVLVGIKPYHLHLGGWTPVLGVPLVGCSAIFDLVAAGSMVLSRHL